MADFEQNKEKLRAELVKLVEDVGGTSIVFKDKIDDYIDYWVIKQQLKEDIRINGVKSEYMNGATQRGDRVNPCIDKLRQIDVQMINILNYLGISIEKVANLVPDEL